MHVLVVGASGDVGRGIAGALLERGHSVLAVARDRAALATLAAEYGHPPGLATHAASVADDDAAARLVHHIQARQPALSAAVVSVNGKRHLLGLGALSTDAFARLIGLDLLPHFAAARAMLPILPATGAFIGIGGGSADFILAGGAHMSVAQAALRMLYRGLAQEQQGVGAAVKLLTIASVVNGASNRAAAKPEWVTDAEIGHQLCAMLESIQSYHDPVYRIGRHGADGVPAFGSDGPTRVQGLTT